MKKSKDIKDSESFCCYIKSRKEDLLLIAQKILSDEIFKIDGENCCVVKNNNELCGFYLFQQKIKEIISENLASKNETIKIMLAYCYYFSIKSKDKNEIFFLKELINTYKVSHLTYEDYIKMFLFYSLSCEFIDEKLFNNMLIKADIGILFDEVCNKLKENCENHYFAIKKEIEIIKKDDVGVHSDYKLLCEKISEKIQKISEEIQLIADEYELKVELFKKLSAYEKIRDLLYMVKSEASQKNILKARNNEELLADLILADHEEDVFGLEEYKEFWNKSLKFLMNNDDREYREELIKKFFRMSENYKIFSNDTGEFYYNFKKIISEKTKELILKCDFSISLFDLTNNYYEDIMLKNKKLTHAVCNLSEKIVSHIFTCEISDHEMENINAENCQDSYYKTYNYTDDHNKKYRISSSKLSEGEMQYSIRKY